MTKAEIVLSAVDQTKAAFDRAARNLQGLGQQASALPAKFGTLGVAIGAAFSAGSLKSVVDTLDRLDDLSEKTGISVARLSELRYAGEVTGTSFESIATGTRKLAVNMAEAASGNKEAAATFKALGVEVTNADGSLRGQDEVLLDIAMRFAGYEDGAAKANLAQKAFGKTGEELIPLLNQGRAGIESLASEARKFGAVYDADVAKAAAEFNDNLKKIQLSAEGAAVTIAGPLVKSLADASTAFIEAKKNGEGFFGVLSRLTLLLPDLQKFGAVLSGLPGFRFLEIFQQSGKALTGPRTTEQIQERVNRENAGRTSAGGGRGFVNPKVVAPVPENTGSTGRAGKSAAQKELEEQQKLLLELSGLTGSFTEDWDRLSAIYAKGAISLQQLTEQQAILLSKQPAIKAQAELEQRIADIRTKNQESANKRIDTLAAENDAMVKSNQSLREEMEELGLTAEAVTMLRMARLDANLAREEENLIAARGIEGNEAEIAQIERRVALLKEERLIKGETAQRELRAQDAEEAKRRSATISESISEGIVDGFRNGRSLGDIFLNELKAQFAKTVLQPVIKPIVEAGNQILTDALKGIAGGIGGFFGGGGADATALPTGDFARLDRLASFDGGGFTGYGPRAGGLDGKGGFLGLIHPNETISDHTKGQGVGSSSSSTTYVFNGGVSRAEVIAGLQQTRVQSGNDVLESRRRGRYGL